MLNFLQNWPVRGSGSSFLSHLSGSDSFCNGIINRAVSFSFLLAARAKNAAISGGHPVLVWLLGTPASGLVGAPAQQGGERDAKDWDLPLQRTEHCLLRDPGCWNHTPRCLAVHHLSLAVHTPPNPLPALQQSSLNIWVHFVTNAWLGLKLLPSIWHPFSSEVPG